MARRGRVERLARGPVVGQQEGAVHGQPLGRRYGERIAVVEADVAVPVADLVVAESCAAAVVGARRDLDRGIAGRPVAGLARSRTRRPPGLRLPAVRLRSRPGRQHLEVFDGDHGAVEELLLPVGGADPQPVADRDLQGRGRAVVLRAPAHHDRYALDTGAVSRALPGEAALAHQVRQDPHLRARARQHRRALLRVLPRVAVPRVHQRRQRPLLVVGEMQPAPLAPGLDRRRRVAVPQRLRDFHLPGREGGLFLHRLVVREDTGAFAVRHQAGPEARRRRGLPVDVDQDVLEVRLLAPDAVDADAPHRVPDQPQAGPRFHRLLLPGVACEHNARAVALGEPQEVMRLARGQHPRLVHHDGGAAVDLDVALRRELQQLVDAERTAVEVVAERHGGAPGHGRGDHRAPVLAAEVGDRPQGGGLARARRPLDDGDAPLPSGDGADRLRLLAAQWIALFGEGCDLLLDRLGRQRVAAVGAHVGRHVAQRLLHPERVAGGVEPGVRHVGPALGRARNAREPHDLGMAQHAPDGRRRRVPAHEPGGGVGHALDDVGKPEHRLLAREFVGQGFEGFRQLAQLFLGDVLGFAHEEGDQLFALAEGQGFPAPAAVSDLGVVVGGLAGARDLVRGRRPGGVSLHLEAHLLRGADDRRTALRPVGLEVLGHAGDAGELPVAAVALDANAQVPVQVPGERVAVDGAGGLDPAVDRMLVHGAPLAVLVGAGGVEDDAVGVELRVVVAAGAVLEHGRHEVGGQHVDLSVAIADAGAGAMAEHRFLQRHPGRVVVRLLDPAPQLGIGDGPERRYALVGREGHVDAGGAALAAGVPREPARAVG